MRCVARMPVWVLLTAVVGGSGGLSAQSKSLPITLTPLWHVGGAADTVVAFSRLFPGDIAVGQGDRLLVVDRELGRLVVLDRNGAVQKPIGRKGQGPGELGYPLGLSVAPSGIIVVYDAARRAFVRMTAEGKGLTELPYRRRGLVQGFRMRSDSTMLIAFMAGDTALVVLHEGASDRVIASAVQPPPASVDAPDCGLLGGMPMPPLFAPRALWADWDGGVVVNRDGAYTLVHYRASGAVVRLERIATRQRTSTALAAQYFGASQRFIIPSGPPCEIPIAKIASAAGMAPLVPAYERLLSAPDGVLWAVRYTPPGAPREADLYGRTGYLGTLSLGAANPVTFFADGRVVSLEADADEVPVVGVYRVAESGR